MNISKNVFVLLLILFTLGLSACSGLTRSDKPSVTTWWLKPYTGIAQVERLDKPVTVSVVVNAVPGLDTNQILSLSHDARLTPYSGARWVDYMPDLVESLLSRSLESSGRFESLSDRKNAETVHCKLELELTEFFANISPSGQTTGVQVNIKGSYQCESESPVAINLEESIPVQDHRMAVIVSTFQQAMDSVSRDLLTQL